MALRLWRWTKWDAVDKYTRAYPTRDSASVGHWPSGCPQKNRNPANSGGGVSPQGTRAPSGGGAGNDSGGQKASSSSESGPQSPFRRRTHLAWPLFHLSTQLSGPELISSGPGDFPFCRPSYIRRMEPQGVVGGTRLPCGELGGGDTGLFARLGRGGLRLARKDTVAFPQEPS